MIKLKDILNETVMDSDNVKRAIEFATKAHGSQKRKYTGDPYIVHPIEVATMLATRGFSEEVVMAAILHDVVEDTPVTNAEIAKAFGSKVASLVGMVTDVSRPDDGNRKARKEMDRQHLAGASSEGKSIKLADLISNSKSITQHDANFAKVYMSEKRELLAALKGGDSQLHRQASEIVNKYYSNRGDK